MGAFWNTLDTVDLIRLIAQWLAVISTIIALVFTMRSSTLKRRSEAQMQQDGEAATWNYEGAQSISEGYSLPGPLSGWVDGYVKATASGKQVRFDDEAISHFEEALKKYPKYPFSYYFLAEAFRLKGDNELAKTYAKQGIEILQVTTRIPNHSPDHDDALKNLQNLLNEGKK